MGPEGSTVKTSENNQEFFVLDTVHYKKNGYFIDIGAADGITASNTFILEKWYNWFGICVDPNPVFLQSLFNCRNSAVSTLCVHAESGKVLPFKFFNDDKGFFGWNFRSGLKEHVSSINDDIDKSFSTINVFSISLNDLLKLYNAPKNIDYLSLDVEGSEYAILSTFDFDEYDIKCITVEHCFTEQRDKIYQLLSKNGYSRVYEERSGQEDWYVKNE